MKNTYKRRSSIINNNGGNNSSSSGINHPTCRVISNKDTHNNHKSYKSIKHTINSSNNPTCRMVNAFTFLTAITILSGLCILMGNSIDAYASQSITFSVQSADVLGLTITDGSGSSLTDNTIGMNITPSVSGGFMATRLRIAVTNNNQSGYTLAMSTPNTNLTRTTALTNGSYPVIPTLSYNGGVGYSESNFPSNTWGYKIDGSTNYLSVPSTVNLVHTNNTGDGTTNLDLAAKVNDNIPSGTYTTTLNFYAVANYVPPVNNACSSNTICYNPNEADGITTMANQSTSSSTTLFASNFSYTNHGFRGWNTKADGSGTYYGPQQTLTIDQLNFAVREQQNVASDNTDVTIATNGLMLYAIWVSETKSMQSFQPLDCANMAMGNVVGLSDTRDGNVYAVARLADGKCWMIENLRLGSNAELTTENTNNPLTSNGSVVLTNSINQDTGDILSTSNRLSASSNEWCTQQSANCYNQTMLNTTNTASPIAEMTSNSQAIYSYGNYYNWYAATAGNGTYGTSTNNSNVSGSLCPSGWHLPRGGSLTLNDGAVTDNNASGNEFYNLMKAIQTVSSSAAEPNQANQSSQAYYDSSTGATGNLRTYPNNFLYSGDWSGGQVGYLGLRGNYWSSTAYVAAYAYQLVFNSTYVSTGTYGGLKHDGFSARCVANS